MEERRRRRRKETQFDIDMAHRAALYNPWREGGNHTTDGTRKKERNVETFFLFFFFFRLFRVELVGKRQVSAPWPGIGHRMEASNKHIRTRRHGRKRPPGGDDGAFRIPTLAGPTQHTQTLTRRRRRRRKSFLQREMEEREIGMQRLAKFNMKKSKKTFFFLFCCGVCQRPLSIIIAVFSWCKRDTWKPSKGSSFSTFRNRNRRLHLSPTTKSKEKEEGSTTIAIVSPFSLSQPSCNTHTRR